MAIENLSEDLLMEILLRLPVKSLLRFKSVCKTWYALIQNPSFIYLHHDRAAARNSDCLLVKQFIHSVKIRVTLSFVPIDTPVEDIDISSTGLDIKGSQILGPCNGVVCLTVCGLTSHIVLCNPSMKEFRVLPQSSYIAAHVSNLGFWFSNLGFGFDPYTNDYKLIRFVTICPGLPTTSHVDETIEMYDLSADSWRIVDVECPIESGLHCRPDSYASWNGYCLWHASRPRGGSSVILAFSISDEVFKQMPVPEVCLSDHHSENKLMVLNNSLAMVIYPKGPFLFAHEGCSLGKSFDIWVMNEEDVEVSWTRKFTIGPFQGLVRALVFRQNGEFLMESGRGQIISYNLYTRERKEYQVQVRGCPPFPPFFQVLLYTESLVSVKR